MYEKVAVPRGEFNQPTKTLIWFCTAFIVGPLFVIVASAIDIANPNFAPVPAAILFLIGYTLLFLGILVLFIETVHQIKNHTVGPLPKWIVLNVASFGVVTVGTIALVIGAAMLVAGLSVPAAIAYTVANAIILVGVSVKLASDQMQISVLYLSDAWKRLQTNPTLANMDYWNLAFRKEWYNLGGTNFYFFGTIAFLLGSAALIPNSPGMNVLGLSFYILASILVIIGSAFKLRYATLGAAVPGYQAKPPLPPPPLSVAQGI